MNILSLLGIDPLGKLIDGLNKAYTDHLNSTTEQEKTQSQERITFFQTAINDLKDARANSRILPWWLAVPMAMIAWPVGIHVLEIGMGSNLAPMIKGTWVGDWLLHIPPWPSPFDQIEGQVTAYFFGAATGLGIAAILKSAVAFWKK